MLIVLASFCCMAVRSFLLFDALGILMWPVLLGFGLERWAGGHGVWGGTLGSLLAFAAACVLLISGQQGFAFTSFAVWLNPLVLLAAGAGTCWGFYVSIWFYLIVETFLQLL
jgi:hypothetical protein